LNSFLFLLPFLVWVFSVAAGWWAYFGCGKGWVVVDLGACVGDSVGYFLGKGAGLVVAVEPVVENFRVLEGRFGGDPRVVLVEAAVWGLSGWGEIFVSDGFASHSMVIPWGFRRRVRTVCWGDLMKETNVQHVDLMKMNIEGGELGVLRGIGGVLPRRVMITEHHTHIAERFDVDLDTGGEICDFLGGLGYDVVLDGYFIYGVLS